MLRLLEVMPPAEFGPFTFALADTDATSLPRARAAGLGPLLDAGPPPAALPRAREVGQTGPAVLLNTARAFFAALALLAAARPALVLANGPGTALPVLLAAALLRAAAGARARAAAACRRAACRRARPPGARAGPAVVYVESVCRVTSLSVTGRVAYALGLADDFQVQWPELHAAYPRTRLVGNLM